MRPFLFGHECGDLYKAVTLVSSFEGIIILHTQCLPIMRVDRLDLWHALQPLCRRRASDCPLRSERSPTSDRIMRVQDGPCVATEPKRRSDPDAGQAVRQVELIAPGVPSVVADHVGCTGKQCRYQVFERRGRILLLTGGC